MDINYVDLYTTDKHEPIHNWWLRSADHDVSNYIPQQKYIHEALRELNELKNLYGINK